MTASLREALVRRLGTSFVSDLHDFWAACGSTGPLRLELAQASAAAEPRTLSTPFAVLGRNPWCDLALSDPDVSLQHAYLQVIAGWLWYVDLGAHSPKPRHNCVQLVTPPTSLQFGDSQLVVPGTVCGDSASLVANPLS